MSDYIARPSHEEDANSGASLQAQQPSWMSHWMKRSLNPTSLVNNSSMISSEGSMLKIEGGFLTSVKRSGKEVEEITSREIITDNLEKKTRDFQHKIGHYNSPFPVIKLGQDADNTVSRKAQMEHEYGDKAISLALSLGQGEDVESMMINNEKRVFPLSRPSVFKEAGSTSRISGHADDASGPVVLFETRLSNDNFTCFDQGRCKYQNFSTILYHEKNMSNERVQSGDDGLQMRKPDVPKIKKDNFVPFFLRKQSKNIGGGQDCIDPIKSCHGWQAGDKVSCSVPNLETMRICTMVDSVENTLGGPPKISQRTRHFLFTKETCVNVSETHQELHNEEKTFGSSNPPRGVKIQPLWTSTDSEEKDNMDNPSICKGESRNESSDETETMQVEEVPEYLHTVLGKEGLCPSNKDNAVNKNEPSPSPGLESNLEKPDILTRVEPAVSLSHGTEPSTLRIRSLDAVQLFPYGCGEQTSGSLELNPQIDRPLPLGLDPNSRWIKRLKSSSDSYGVVGTKSLELGNASSNVKFSQLSNRIMQSNKAGLDNTVSEHEYDKEENVVKSVGNSVLTDLISKQKHENTAFDSSWIQRWCRKSPTPANPEPVTVFEAHSLKLDENEVSNKQFPSIGAMALMGKAMNGFRPCEFKKRGPIVVWNTNNY